MTRKLHQQYHTQISPHYCLHVIIQLLVLSNVVVLVSNLYNCKWLFCFQTLFVFRFYRLAQLRFYSRAHATRIIVEFLQCGIMRVINVYRWQKLNLHNGKVVILKTKDSFLERKKLKVFVAGCKSAKKNPGSVGQ